MRLLRLLAAPLAIFSCTAFAADVAALRVELEAMRETDQSQRRLLTDAERQHGQNSPEVRELWKKQNEIDAQNIRRLEEIIAEHGWPKRSEVGEGAASAAFLILQHSDIAYQKKYLALAREAAAGGEMRPASLALLEDRILLRDGKKQIYGSQVSRNAAGEWEALPLEDPEHVDERRAKVGLGSLAKYLQGFADRSGGKVADSAKDRPIENAPPLASTLFSPTDDARVALEKLQKAPAQRGEAALIFQRACRDFCVRFPNSPRYAEVRVLAARRSSLVAQADFALLGDWDPAAGETDPKLSAEQRAEVALDIAQANTDRTDAGLAQPDPDVRFDRIARALVAHRATDTARNGLISAALDADASKAIALLRERYPEDAAAKAAIAVLEQNGRPGDLQFTSLQGPAFDLRAQRGKVVFVVFMNRGSAGWTAKMLADVETLARTHGADNFTAVVVSMESDRAAIETLLKETGIAWPLFHDGRGWSNALAERYLVKISPYYLLFDRGGVLRFRGVGPNSPIAERRIAALIAEPPPSAQ